MTPLNPTRNTRGIVKWEVKGGREMRYQMYCKFGPTTYPQERITIWDRIAKLLGWLDWVEID